MTQLRKFRDSISNYFDDLERGIGKRGSTFTDVDAISHDKDTRRFLFREFKHDAEPLDRAQEWTLRELAGLERCTVWLVRKLDDGRIGWQLFRVGVLGREIALTTDQYRQKVHDWWYAQDQIQDAGPPADDDLPAPSPARVLSFSTCVHNAEFKENGRCRVCDDIAARRRKAR